MKVLHLLVAGNRGGIETLMKNYAMYSKLDNTFVFVWNGGPVTDEMAQMGFRTIVLEKEKLGTIRTIKKIVEICRQKKIDVVVSHHSAPLLKVILLCLKVTNCPVRTIAYAHANARDICGERKKRNLWIRKSIHRMAFLTADAVIAISESVKASLSCYLGIKRPISVIYNGVPVQHFYKRTDAEEEKLSLIYVGRLIEEKGVQTTIKALARVKDTVPFIFHILGDGSYREQLEALTKKYMLEDHVQFHGTQSDVTEYLAQSDVFVHMPEWEEGFGITIIEAMAAGCVCVCSANGAVPEIITDAENGFLVEKSSDKALARKIIELSENLGSARLCQIRQRAVQRASDFSIEKYCRELDSFIEQI